MTNQATIVNANTEEIVSWLSILHGDSPGLINICSTGNWAGRCFPANEPEAAAAYAATLDNCAGTYVRMTTLRQEPPAGSRGTVAGSWALPALWADLDIAGPGHAERDLPHDEAAARRVIETSGLPEPTCWIHSGGGLYPIWLLRQPHLIGADLPDVAAMSEAWQRVIGHAAAQLGYRYGTGVHDLARVLRIPGTVNRKEGLARPCRILTMDGPVHEWDELRVALAAAVSAIPTPEPGRYASPVPAPITNGHGPRPGDDFKARTSWERILEPHGWTRVRRVGQTVYWCRPGKNPREGVSATTGHDPASGVDPAADRLFVFSTSTVFPALEPVDKFHAFAILNHGSDHGAAAKELRSLGFGQARAVTVVAADAWVADPPAANGEQQPPLMVAAMATPSSPYTMDQMGNAQRFADQHGATVRWVMDGKPGWSAYDGVKWSPAGAATMAKSAMIQTIDGLESEDVLHDDVRPEGPRGKELPSSRDKFQKFRMSARSDAQVKGALSLAEGQLKLWIKSADFDPGRDLLNLPNAVLDLANGKSMPNSPAHLMTRAFGTAYDPDARAPMWERYLEMNVPDPQVRSYLQRAAGYALTGRSNEKKMFYLYGKKDTGKTIFCEVLSALFGDYGVTAAEDTLRPKRNTNGPSNDINDMRKARFVTTSETRPGQEMDEALVKRLTGGDSLRTRGLYQENRTWNPECVLFVASNQYPRVTGDDDAIWERIRVIRFDRAFPEGDPDRDNMLRENIKDRELSGVLNWALSGLADYLANGLNEPEAVAEWSEEFRSEQDGVARFVDDLSESGVLVKSPDESASRTEMYNRYRQWAQEEGLSPLSSRRFYPRMATLGFHCHKGNPARVIIGLRINRSTGDQWLGSGIYRQ